MLAGLLLTGCNDAGKTDELTRENESLRTEIRRQMMANADLQREAAGLTGEVERLRRELDVLKNAPQTLLAEGKRLNRNGAYDKAIAHAAELIERYPDTPQAREARVLADSAKTALEKSEREGREQAKALETRRAQAVKSLKREYDKVSRVAWYTSPALTSAPFQLYIGVRDKEVWLRRKLLYHYEEWIFFKNALAYCDGKTYDLPPGEVHRDNNLDGVWEWSDQPVTSADLDAAAALTNAKDSMIRFTGRSYRRDVPMTVSMRKGLRRVLDAYDVLRDVGK